MGTALAVATVLLFVPSVARAIPGFARKYGTSCQTCHTVFPRLTPFGEAFRENGHRFPEDDDDKVKDEPVSLGSKAYEKVFPKAVWPGQIPAMPAFSAILKGGLTAYDRSAEAKTNFNGLSPAFDLYVAGAVASRVSVLAKVQVNGPACANCHTYAAVEVSDLLPHSNIKIGRFQPEYFGFHQQPFTEFHDVLGPARRVGANPWNFGKDVGIEAAGVVWGSLRYVAGVNEGQDNFGLNDAAKGVYARLGYKLGGMRLDGLPRPGYEAPTENWRERSLLFGFTGYRGSSTVKSNDAEGAEAIVQDDFYAVIGDASLNFSDLAVFGGGIVESHAQPTGTDSDIWAERYFAGARYSIFPWLVPVAMFDYFNSQLPGDYTYQIRPRLEILARANIKLRLDAAFSRPVGERLAFQRVEAEFYVGF